jgi:hypothetical protein
LCPYAEISFLLALLGAYFFFSLKASLQPQRMSLISKHFIPTVSVEASLAIVFNIWIHRHGIVTDE